MRTYQILTNVASSTNVGSENTSGSAIVYPTQFPDDYGVVTVKHSGSKLAASSTLTVSLQGSVDGTNWWDVQVMRPQDTAYQAANGQIPSWCVVTPAFPQMRIQLTNNSTTLTFNAWIHE